VLKYLKLASDYGKLSSDDHNAIDAIIHNMVYASSADVYETNRASLKALCTRTGFDAFDRYMDDNWNSCTDMWIRFKRDKPPHFKVQTNNHLESWFGKFKAQIDASMSMTQTVGRREVGPQHADFVQVLVDHDYFHSVRRLRVHAREVLERTRHMPVSVALEQRVLHRLSVTMLVDHHHGQELVVVPEHDSNRSNGQNTDTTWPIPGQPGAYRFELCVQSTRMRSGKRASVSLM
jgi:hypothetical protein